MYVYSLPYGSVNSGKMKLQYFLISSLLLLLMEQIHAIPPWVPDANDSSSLANRRNDESEEQRVVREKRSPLGKLALLGGAAVVGKKALLLGGAALGAKALVGAGILGAGLYKTKYYGASYGGRYANNNHYEWDR